MILPLAASAGPVYPPSSVIESIAFDMSTLRNTAPGNGVRASGSDNWTITWADDGNQYTSWGDGPGFSTSNSTRASLGVARIEGDKTSYSAYDVFKTGDVSGGWAGKSLGIVSVDGALYMFRNGQGSTNGAFDQTELYTSNNHGSSWSYTGVKWTFGSKTGFYSPTFLQFGKDYQGARDGYVYIYANENKSDEWNVQFPGEITLIRVPRGQLAQQSAYQFFSGLDGSGNPTWSSNLADRKPAFRDAINGSMRTSVSYNAGLGRYILVTQQVDRFESANYHIGIYEAPEPWGPWHTVLFANPKEVGPGLNTGSKTVYWNFSNKWLSSDGHRFVMVYTGPGPDEWGTIEGSFIPRSTDSTPPSAPSGIAVASKSETKITLSWAPAIDPDSGVLKYRIYRDGSMVGETSDTSFVDNGLTHATTYQYQVSAINGVLLESNKSALLSTSTLTDSVAPAIQSVSASDSATSVTVVFSETVTVSSSESIANYHINNGIEVIDASLDSDRKSVTLTTSTLAEGTTYTLTVNNVRDSSSAANPIASNSSKIFTHSLGLKLTALTVASGKTYAWESGIDPGNQTYLDRAFSYTSVPPEYVSMQYLRTANDDKASSASAFISFMTNKPISVYVGYAQTSNLPAWLSSWSSTGDSLINTDRELHLYRKDFPAGNVILGGNAGASSMYVVLVDTFDGSSPAPPPLPSVALSASPQSVAYNGSTTLTWSSSNTTACSASGGWSGSKGLTGTQNFSGIKSNVTYSLTCTGSGGTHTASVSVSVAAAPSASVALDATDTSVSIGGYTTLNWTANNVTACAASNAWSGNKAFSGSMQVGPLAKTSTYVLTCTDLSGNKLNDSVTVSVTTAGDSDGDGLSDTWEMSEFGNLTQSPAADPDGDGLSNIDEFKYGTNPTHADSDGDGDSDFDEVTYDSDPTNAASMLSMLRPVKPTVATISNIPAWGGAVDVSGSYSDPNGDALHASQWQISTEQHFATLVIDRTIPDATTFIVPTGALESGKTYWIRTRHSDKTGIPSIWSEPKSFTARSANPNDTDANGTDDRFQVFGSADANSNGVKDTDEGLCNLLDSVNGNIIGIGTTRGMTECLTSVGMNDSTIYAKLSPAQSLPYGMFTFAIRGLPVDPANPATATVSIHFPDAVPANSQWFKYDESTGEFAAFQGTYRIEGRTAFVTLRDGGPEDADGVVNGVILDPSGFITDESATAPETPTQTGTVASSGGGGSLDPVTLASLALLLALAFTRRQLPAGRGIYRTISR